MAKRWEVYAYQDDSGLRVVEIDCTHDLDSSTYVVSEDVGSTLVEIHNADIEALEAELAAQAPDAKLGAAVRRLPDGVTLGPSRGRWYVCDDDGVLQGEGSTPDAALAAAGLMEPPQ